MLKTFNIVIGSLSLIIAIAQLALTAFPIFFAIFAI